MKVPVGGEPSRLIEPVFRPIGQYRRVTGLHSRYQTRETSSSAMHSGARWATSSSEEREM